MNSKEPLVAKRKSHQVFLAEKNRVITRFFSFSENRNRNLAKLVLSMTENEVSALFEQVLQEFASRHRNFRNTLEKHYDKLTKFLPIKESISKERKLLLASYFTHEYSVEAAALFNPSIVLHPDQRNLGKDTIRFVMSFRATGEGHISSIEFRSGKIDHNNDIFFDPVSDYLERPEIHPNPSYLKHLFQLKLDEMGACNNVTTFTLNELPKEFSYEELEKKIAGLYREASFEKDRRNEAIRIMRWLANSNYEISFRADHRISERVIFPVSEGESRGIEDARFVRFIDDNGDATYYATYTAYDGFRILPQLIETNDFITFQIITLNGRAVQNKGMALFPRRINGKYVMLSRQDGENNHIMFSENLHFWQESKIIQKPSYPWEFVQIGNCGSPIETEAGWLLLTHGVGPMRKYSIGVELLDLNDPSKIIARLDEPVLVPNEQEREGYVPNVVYSCGGIIHKDELVIPFAMSDSRSGVAALPLSELLLRLQNN